MSKREACMQDTELNSNFLVGYDADKGLLRAFMKVNSLKAFTWAFKLSFSSRIKCCGCSELEDNTAAIVHEQDATKEPVSVSITPLRTLMSFVLITSLS